MGGTPGGDSEQGVAADMPILALPLNT